MRITYIHQQFRRPDEAGGTRSYEFARRLARDGHAVKMISSGEGAKSYELAGFQVVQLPMRYDNAMSFSSRSRLSLPSWPARQLPRHGFPPMSSWPRARR